MNISIFSIINVFIMHQNENNLKNNVDKHERRYLENN
jgi:hypothetical protein